MIDSLKRKFFVKCSVTESFPRENFRYGDNRNQHGLSFQNIYMRGVDFFLLSLNYSLWEEVI